MVKKHIEKHIEKILEDFTYKNMKDKHPDYCPCLNDEGPCHDIEELNCFLCYCPEYDWNKEEGGCKIGNPKGKGKWYKHPNLLKGKIWDCSDCTYPHEKETVRKYLRKMFKL